MVIVGSLLLVKGWSIVTQHGKLQITVELVHLIKK